MGPVNPVHTKKHRRRLTSYRPVGYRQKGEVIFFYLTQFLSEYRLSPRALNIQ